MLKAGHVFKGVLKGFVNFLLLKVIFSHRLNKKDKRDLCYPEGGVQRYRDPPLAGHLAGYHLGEGFLSEAFLKGFPFKDLFEKFPFGGFFERSSF